MAEKLDRKPGYKETSEPSAGHRRASVATLAEAQLNAGEHTFAKVFFQ
jgi:hypothetical protein